MQYRMLTRSLCFMHHDDELGVCTDIHPKQEKRNRQASLPSAFPAGDSYWRGRSATTAIPEMVSAHSSSTSCRDLGATREPALSVSTVCFIQEDRMNCSSNENTDTHNLKKS
jgi:hypothetical protein